MKFIDNQPIENTEKFKSFDETKNFVSRVIANLFDGNNAYSYDYCYSYKQVQSVLFQAKKRKNEMYSIGYKKLDEGFYIVERKKKGHLTLATKNRIKEARRI